MTKIVELKVYGMTCDDCVRHVSGGLKEAEGITDVSVSLKDGVAVVKAMDSVEPENLLKLDVFKGQYRAQLRSVKDD
jgi:copper chaperone CopZ